MPSPTQTQAMIDRSFGLALAILAGGIGTTFYVDSTHAHKGTTVDKGRTKDAPFSTLAYAFSSDQLTANNGDVVIVASNHAETISAAAGVVCDIAGVTVIGCGVGDDKPTFSFTASTSDIDIDAANIKFINLRFASGSDALEVMLDVNQGGFEMEECDLFAQGQNICINFVNLATTKDNFAFRRCRWLSELDPNGTDGAASTGGIYCVDTEGLLVEDCTFDGYIETACLHNKTTALKYLTWRRNNVNQQLTITGRRILLVAGTIGADIGPDTDFVPGLGYRIQKTEDVNTASADVLFTVAGQVLVNEWIGEVTNALHTTVTDYKLNITGGGDLQAAGDLNSAAIGYLFRMNSDAGDTTLATTTPAVSVVKHADIDNDAGPARRIIGAQGLASITLEATRTAGAAGDAILHTIWYIPLEPGAYVVAAA